MPRLVLLVALNLLVVRPGAGAVQQLTATEISAGGLAVMARHSFTGGELGFARRSVDTRVAFAVAGGDEAGSAAARAQLTIQMLVNSAARTGVGIYAGLGGACSVRRDTAGKAWLAVLLGLEARPGRGNGWYLELGLSGGVRAAAGWRLRSFPPWWR